MSVETRFHLPVWMKNFGVLDFALDEAQFHALIRKISDWNARTPEKEFQVLTLSHDDLKNVFDRTTAALRFLQGSVYGRTLFQRSSGKNFDLQEIYFAYPDRRGGRCFTQVDESGAKKDVVFLNPEELHKAFTLYGLTDRPDQESYTLMLLTHEVAHSNQYNRLPEKELLPPSDFAPSFENFERQVHRIREPYVSMSVKAQDFAPNALVEADAMTAGLTAAVLGGASLKALWANKRTYDRLLEDEAFEKLAIAGTENRFDLLSDNRRLENFEREVFCAYLAGMKRLHEGRNPGTVFDYSGEDCKLMLASVKNPDILSSGDLFRNPSKIERIKMPNYEIERKWVTSRNAAAAFLTPLASKVADMEQGYLNPRRGLIVSDRTLSFCGTDLPVFDAEQFDRIIRLIGQEGLSALTFRYRILKENGKKSAVFTIKGPGKGLANAEEEFSIDPLLADSLQKTALGSISKRRLYVKDSSHTIEADFYHEKHEFDFAMLEVEFSNESDARKYAFPKAYQAALRPIDVSDRFEFKNVRLMLHPEAARKTYADLGR